MIYNLRQKLLIFILIFSTALSFAQSPEVYFTGVFDGTVVNEDGSYIMPTGSMPWAGFANEDVSLYPLTFGEGGTITFSGYTDGSSADIYFKFEKNPYPDTEPSFSTAIFTLGPESSSYTVDIPSQGGFTFSSFLLYVTTPDVSVTLNNVVVNSSDYSGVLDVYGCMDSNASNYNADANIQGYDQYGNLQCVYESCDDVPEYGCIYADGFGAFAEGFGPVECSQYGGTPCEQVGTGCLDINATNYDINATVQGYDVNGNLQCVYASCDDIPEFGCIYEDGFGGFAEGFGPAECSSYGGIPCEEEVVGVVGCMDENSINYDADATVQGYDQYGNLQCVYASCDDIPVYGCIYGDGFGEFNEDFTAELCSQYGGTPCEEYVPTVHTVLVGPGYSYDPPVLSISPGDVVNWISQGGYHDVNFDINSITGESFGNPSEIASASLPVSVSGDMGSITFNEAGVYNYDCSIGNHAVFGMVGSIIVANPLVITTTICQEADSVRLTGPYWEWDVSAGPVATDNGDGTWTFIFDPAPTENMEYLLVIDGVQEDLVSAGSSSDDWSCTPITDYFSYANRVWEVGSGDVSVVYGTCGTECPTDVPDPGAFATIEFSVDMNGVDQPSTDYDNVVVNGSWNGWNGWGVTLSDEDSDGVFTGSLEIDPGTSFEYVVAVTGAADSWSGWGMQWGDGCNNVNVAVTAGDAGTVTPSLLTPGCSEVLGCLDSNATNFNPNATVQGLDQYGNLQCNFASCDDIPQPGCIYEADGVFGAFNEEFGDSLCLVYGGIPCNSQGSSITDQTIELTSGWSMFSTYMLADDMALDVILNPILVNVIIAKDYLGAAFLPEWNFNGVGDLTVGQGYQIKTSESISLNISGTYMLPEENPINLEAGWNMIGYLRTSPAAADAVLADMNASGNLIIAKDYLGSAYLPEWSFNGIGDLNPGQAYQIKVNNSDVLQYNSNDDDYRLSSSVVIDNSTSIINLISVTDNNMTLIIEDKAWSNIPEEDSEIAVMDDSGLIFGAAKYTPNVSVITVWGDDNTTSEKDGFFSGEQLNLKILSDSKFIDLEVEDISYEINSIELVSNVTSDIPIEENKVLQRVVNILGQDVINYENNQHNRVLFMIYSDGFVEKVVK